MPVSQPHDARVRIIRENPELITLFCSRLGVKTPEGCTLATGSDDCNTTTPMELTRDSTFIYRSEDNIPQFAVCCEVQLRVDPGREWVWPVYLTKLRLDLKCPVVLLVLTPDPAVVRWCSRGFDTGHPGFILIPITIGPDQTDRITALEDARNNLGLAVLSALTHGDTPEGLAILDTVVEALNEIRVDEATRYAELILRSLKGAGKLHLEHLMDTKDFEYTSDYARRLEARGEAQGKARGKVEEAAKNVLIVLKARGVPVTPHARDRIRACADAAQLERWLERAVHIEHIDALFQ